MGHEDYRNHGDEAPLLANAEHPANGWEDTRDHTPSPHALANHRASSPTPSPYHNSNGHHATSPPHHALPNGARHNSFPSGNQPPAIHIHPHYESDIGGGGNDGGVTPHVTHGDNPFVDRYDIPLSPADQAAAVAARHGHGGGGDHHHPPPQQQGPHDAHRPSYSSNLSVGGAGGITRKFTRRISEAISNATRVPYQPIYHTPFDGANESRPDLHGELRDEWDVEPHGAGTDGQGQYQGHYHNDRGGVPYIHGPHGHGASDKISELERGEDDSEDIKREIPEDEKYLIAYSPDEPRHPYNWPLTKKYVIIGVMCSAAICVTATSSIQASTYNSIERQFQISRSAAVSGVSLYVLGLGIGAMFLGPMSEFFGRANIYLVSFALFTVMNVPIATAQSAGVFLLFRFFTGLCGSGFLSIAGGTISDLFRPGTVDAPMAIYTLAPLVGPTIGPLIGGYINQNVSFRVTFYVVIGWSGLTFALLWFFVPETFLPKILQREAQQKRLETNDGKWYAPLDRSQRTYKEVFPAALWQPVRMMIKEPMALVLNTWTALILGLIYLFFNAIPFTFRTVYAFDLQTTGLCFLPMALGMILGTASQWFFIRNVRDRALRAGGKAPPEARLPVGMCGAVIVPVGLLWFALSSFTGMSFIMPMIGIFLFGIGSVYVFTCVWGFLVSSYPKYAASAMAGNTLLRCIWAAGFPLFADPMYRGLGPMKATAILVAVSGVMAPIPFVLYRIGPKLRTNSSYSK